MKNTLLYWIRGLLLLVAIKYMNDSDGIYRICASLCIWIFVTTLDKYEK